MKILLLNQTFYPDNFATAQQLTDLAEFLIKQKYSVSIIAERRNYETRVLSYAPKEIYNGIKIFRIWSTGFGKKSFFLRFIDGITFELFLFFRLLFFPRQDIVISFTSPPLIGFIGAIFGTIWGARKIQWLMDINPDIALAVGYIKNNSIFAKILKKALEFSLTYSTDIVVLDRCMRKKVIEKSVKAEKITIIPPWPSHNFILKYNNLPKDNIFRQHMQLNGKFLVCYSGNHSIVHPFDTILEAIRNLASYEDIVFLFIGGGVRVGEILNFKEKYKLKNIVQLPLQPRETLKYSLTAADVHLVVMGDKVNGLVHVSKIYGILATGRPYIYVGPSDSAISDIVKETSGGIHIETGHVDKFVDAVLKIKGFTNEELTHIERVNTSYVSTHYSFQQSMQKFTKLLGSYEQVQEALLELK